MVHDWANKNYEAFTNHFETIYEPFMINYYYLGAYA